MANSIRGCFEPSFLLTIKFPTSLLPLSWPNTNDNSWYFHKLWISNPGVFLFGQPLFICTKSTTWITSSWKWKLYRSKIVADTGFHSPKQLERSDILPNSLSRRKILKAGLFGLICILAWDYNDVWAHSKLWYKLVRDENSTYIERIMWRGTAKKQNYLLEGRSLVVQAFPTRWVF